MAGKSSHSPSQLLHDVPLFPLPNVVLFPRAILPLHIFEPRYRRMTADALNGERRIAMALLRDAWQNDYHGTPPIHEVVCVGTILAHELLPDGRYNLLLQGEARAAVVAENRSLSYRRAELRPLAEQGVFDVDLASERERLVETIYRSELISTTLGREIGKLLDSPIATADIADICAFNLLDDVLTKQRLLADLDVAHRVREIVGAVRALHARDAGSDGEQGDGGAWARSADLN